MKSGLIAFLILGLAGCTPAGIRSATPPKSIAQSSGNGDSYSGKTFVLQSADPACGIESAILYDYDGDFFLTRENCTDLNPYLPLAPEKVDLRFQNGELMYEGEIYRSEYNPACSYPEFTGMVPPPGECTATQPVSAVESQNRVGDGTRYEFAMYNASSSTHGYSGRSITYQRVDIAAGLAADSVDLVLSSYEPVRWEFSGNVAAVRSVHIRGYHCATYTGISGAKVSLSTYEQGDSPNVLNLPLSLNLGASTSAYEGSCLANRTLVIQ